MKIDVLTLFPEMVQGPMTQSIIGKAIEAGKIEFETTDFRQFSNNKHNHVDDYPFGGGAGMLLKVEPIDLALASIRGGENIYAKGRRRIIEGRASSVYLWPL